jgi:hypothetical protein
MKAKTRIVTAAKKMYDAYTDYSRVVLNVPVVPDYPQVTWCAGNRADGGKGTWVVDGREYPGVVGDVEVHFLARAKYWREKTEAYIAKT